MEGIAVADEQLVRKSDLAKREATAKEEEERIN